MNKLFTTVFSLAMFLPASVSANAEVKPVKAIEKATSAYEHNYIYNEKNQLVWEFREGSTRTEYTYNEAGKLVKATPYNWVSYDNSFAVGNVEEYTYDAEGNVAQMTETKSNGDVDTYTYTKYECGVATEYSRIQRKPSGNEYKYDYKVELTLDAEGRIVKALTSELDYDYLDDGFCGYEGHEYEYDADGNVAVETITKYNYSFDKPKTPTTMTYTYAEVDEKYAPKNLSAVNNNGTVTLTWDAVEGATSYIVSYDITRKEVTTNAFSVTVSTGERQFTVQAVVDGVERNGAMPVTAEIIDPGKLPITDLAVGEMKLVTLETESIEMPTRDFYQIPLTWTLPEGHSEIKDIRVYYVSRTYGETYMAVGNASATSYAMLIDPYEVADEDGNGGYVNGDETPIYVRIVYVTGESEKSNVFIVNPQLGTSRPESIMGDVNGDGSVNVFDVVAIAEYVVNGTDDVDLATADMNNDGSINVFDVVALAEKILNE